MCTRAFLPSSAATAATSAAASADDLMNVEVDHRDEQLEGEEYFVGGENEGDLEYFVGGENEGDLASGEGAHRTSE